MLDSLLLLGAFARAVVSSRAELAAEHLLLHQQLSVLTRPMRKRPRLQPLDSAFWALARRLRRDWRHHLLIVRREIVIRWHRRGWRLFWHWRSAGPLGRPRLPTGGRELIAAMARDNPRWGSERLRGEVLKLGITVSTRSIQRYRQRGHARPPSQTWRTFLANHRPQLWASDLGTVQTLTFRTLYVLVVITHGRRELVHLQVTAHPTAAWVWRHLVEPTSWGRRPKHRIRGRDRVSGHDVRDRAEALGIATGLTPVRAPRANAVAERVIGTLCTVQGHRHRSRFSHIVPAQSRRQRQAAAGGHDVADQWGVPM